MNKKYKPLLLTTTMRNPERLKTFLAILSEYDQKILNNDISIEVAKKLIKRGLYKPMKIDDQIRQKWKDEIELNDLELNNIIINNPQDHKEAGFDNGWPSRFDTWFKLAKELGFVWYQQNSLIRFSETGKMLLDKDNPQNELIVFANAFAKYQRDNPFRRVLNKNNPLVLLLQTIQFLNNDIEYKGTGISKKEIPLVLCWKDNDAYSLYIKIKNLRKKYGFTPSNEVILEICYKLLDAKKRDNSSILEDYPDEFIRKIRLTGLISLRGGGRFIDLNTKELNAINFVIEKYKILKDFTTESEFFNYMGIIDTQLFSVLSVYKSPVRIDSNELIKWVDYYSWKVIKYELLGLATKKSSKDNILKLIEQPLRLEFLTSLAILKKLPAVVVKPNFISDDEGLPTSFAPGGNPDIECQEGQTIALIEVTLLTGTQQHIRESFSVHRHLEEYKKKETEAYSVFISPKSFIDTTRYAKFIKNDGFEIRIIDIDQFVNNLEKFETLNESTLVL